MNVAQEAKQVLESQREDFAAILLRCFFCGVVIRRPDFILLAEEVFTDGQIVLATAETDIPKNCWFLYYLGHRRGCYSPFDYMAEAPYPHFYVGYKRRGRIVIREWEKLKKDISYQRMTYGRITFSPST